MRVELFFIAKYQIDSSIGKFLRVNLRRTARYNDLSIGFLAVPYGL